MGFGDVTADSIAGSAEISTGSGKVQIGEVEGTAVVRSSNGSISVDRAGASVDLEIGTAEGTAARLAVNTGHGHVRNLLESAARPGEADETRRGARPHLLQRHHHLPLLTLFRHWRRRATMTINQSRPTIAATALRRLASAIERGGGEDTGREGASR